jgi:hypothetical protein
MATQTKQPPSNGDKYTYRVIWSEEDREHVGLCAEFPSLSHLAPSVTDALNGVVALVADVVADMRASGETPPSAPSNSRARLISQKLAR